MARGLFRLSFISSPTLPLFKLLELVGLTLALCCYNLKSSGQQQLFPGSLSGTEWRLESSSPVPTASLLFFTAVPPFPFFDRSTRDHLPLLDFHPIPYHPATSPLKTSSSDFNPALCHPFLFSHFTRYKQCITLKVFSKFVSAIMEVTFTPPTPCPAPVSSLGLAIQIVRSLAFLGWVEGPEATP
jgi:hypothetical protein